MLPGDHVAVHAREVPNRGNPVAGVTGGAVPARRPQQGDVPPDLLAAAGAGDLRARARLLAVVRRVALQYGRSRLRAADDVLCSPEDVAQEVCVAVLGALGGYEPTGRSFHAFVLGITRHKIADAHRAARRDRCAPAADLPEVPAPSGGPEQRLLAAERAEHMQHLLADLTPRQRQVLALRVVTGLSAEETARIVGGTAAAVRLTQHRALNRLRRVLEETPGREHEQPRVRPRRTAARGSAVPA